MGGRLGARFLQSENRDQRNGCKENVLKENSGLFKDEKPASGIYPAHTGKVIKKGLEQDSADLALSYVTLEDGDQWYSESFGFTDADLLLIETRGSFNGTVTVSHDAKGKNVIGEYEVDSRNDYWELHLVPFVPDAGRHPLCIRFDGKGTMELRSIGFISA